MNTRNTIDNWPAEAVLIMEKAGSETEHQDILNH